MNSNIEMDDPVVSIAIPVYNGEKFLRMAIQSVLNQTYKKWILFLINDGSTDDSLIIMQEFAAKDNRIKIINDGCNRGLVSRLNQSIALAETKYYARMDADDIMHIKRIEEQVSFLDKNPKIDVLGTSIMTIDSRNSIIGSGLSCGKVDHLIHPTIMGRTNWFKSNPYMKWALRAEDTELWFRTSCRSSFWALDKPLLFYREFGVTTLRKCLQSQKTLILIYANYKQYRKTFFWAFFNIIKTILKMMVYVFFALFGQIDRLVVLRRRNKISPMQCLSQIDLLESITPHCENCVS